MRVLFLLTLQLYCAFAFADVEFGAEFTFTNDLMKQQYKDSGRVSTDEARRVFAILERDARQACYVSDCKVVDDRVKGLHAFKIKFKDGFHILVSLDPQVIEFTMSKGTVRAFEAQRERIQSFVFDKVKSLGLYADPKKGGGHLNIDLASAFGEDAVSLRNFIVDQANFPELQLYIMGGHFGNAPPIAILHERSRNHFIRIIDEFDKKPTSIKELLQNIEFDAYTSNPLGWLSTRHYQALRFILPIGNPWKSNGPKFYERMELRYLRAQDSLDKFLQQARLFEKRIAYVKSPERALALVLREDLETSPAAQIEAFSNWLSELGETLEAHKNLMSPELQSFYQTEECRKILKP